MTSEIHGRGSYGGVGLDNNTIYLSTSKDLKVAVAHNSYNFGNFLWGASAAAVGLSKGLAKFGAHYNNYYNDPKNKGHLDSKDDQKSIGLGFDYWKDIQKNKP